MSAPTSALEGLTVVDLSQILAGPFCTMMLADLGADVIKVERPGRGDDTRSWGPPWQGEASSYFMSVNRGKRSITVDLKSPAGVELVTDLAEHADVFVQNFRPGVVDRLGLSYPVIAARNPSIVYCSLSGFGSDGPYATRTGYDALIQAMGGLMSITGQQGGPPTKVGVAIVDILAGLYALSGILSAVHARTRTGRGQHVDISLLDSLIASLANQGQSTLATGCPPGRLGNAHPSIVPYQTFAAADREFMLAVGNDDQFRRLCLVLGRPDLSADPRFATNPERVHHRDQLIPLLDQLFASRSFDELSAELCAKGIPVGPINDLGAAFADAQVRHRDMITELIDGSGRAHQFAGNPIKLSETPARPRSLPPALGADTRAVLRDRLGLDEAAIGELIRSGALGDDAAHPQPQSPERDPDHQKGNS